MENISSVASKINAPDPLLAAIRALPDHALAVALARELSWSEVVQLDAFFKAAGFRPKSIRHAAARSPHHRSTREPRRRASRTAAAATRAGPGDGDDPPPRVASDRTCEGLYSIPARSWRPFLQENGVPFANVGRRTVARISDVDAALDRLIGRAAPTLDEADVIELASRRKAVVR